MLQPLQLKVNGQVIDLKSVTESTALQTIRKQLGLTASRYGCGQEQCGACHVLIDGQSKPTCQLPAGTLVGRSIATLESAMNLDLPSTLFLRALQSKFLEAQAAQCGYAPVVCSLAPRPC